MPPIMEALDIRKVYKRGAQIVEALKGVSLTVESGQFVSIMGPSGSGKSTLMHIAGGLDRATSGSVHFKGESIDSYTDATLSVFRRRHLGFIFQFFNLVPTLSALENVSLPMLLDGKRMKDVAQKSTRLLEDIGLGHRLNHYPDQLSGGEMQRVAIARALVTDPILILADEPTGNLDSKTGTAMLELLASLVRTRNHAILMVTHDPRAASFGDRVVTLRDGLVESDAAPALPRQTANA